MASQQFNEAAHPRGHEGRFAEKQQTDPGSSVLTAPADWTSADWTPTDEDPDIVELTGPGNLYASISTVHTEVPSSADYDLPHTNTRYDWMIADSSTGAEITHGTEPSMAMAQRAAQRAGQAAAGSRAARPEWDWSTADTGYISGRDDAHIGDEVRAYYIGFGVPKVLLGATGRIVSVGGPTNAKIEFTGPLYNDQGRLVLPAGETRTGTLPYNLLIRRNK